LERIKEFESYLKNERRLSPHTLRAYLDDLAQASSFFLENAGTSFLDKLNHLQIRSWMADLSERGVSARSINRKLSSLNAYFRYLQKQGLLEINPMKKVTGPKTSKKLPVFIEEKSIEHLFTGDFFPDNFMGLRDKTLLELFYATGIRRSELINLKVDDFDPSGKTLKVVGKRKKERIVPLAELTTRQLEFYLEQRNTTFPKIASNELFVSKNGKRLNPGVVYSIVRCYLSKVTTVARKSPHILRHSFATHLLNHGAELNAIKELLGHANLSATQVYTHNTIDKLKETYRNAHQRSNKK
jgi:integrase/recombinase XerC